MAVFGESRQKRQQARQQQRSTRQGVRQSKRAERQKARQQARTQRVQARQTSKQAKEAAKAAGGFYSPAGQQAKWTGIADVSTVGAGAARDITGGILTGGASLAGGGLTDFFRAGNGGAVMTEEVYTGDLMQMPDESPWYTKPDNQRLLLGGLVAAGAAAWWLNRPKKKGA